MKVYCQDCKHLKAHHGRLECNFGKYLDIGSTPMHPVYHMRFEDFNVKNKDNNCPDFKKSKLRFWR